MQVNNFIKYKGQIVLFHFCFLYVVVCDLRRHKIKKNVEYNGVEEFAFGDGVTTGHYDLNGVVVQHGGAKGGHYIAYAPNVNSNNDWCVLICLFQFIMCVAVTVCLLHVNRVGFPLMTTTMSGNASLNIWCNKKHFFSFI